MKKSGFSLRHFYLVTFFLVFGCVEDEKALSISSSTGPVVAEIYHAQLSNDSGDSYSGTVSAAQLRDCITSYCQAVHSTERYENETTEYVSFRAAVCRADLFSQMVDSLESLQITQDGAPLVGNDYRDSFSFSGFYSCSAWSYGVVNDGHRKITFSPLQT